jgi:predicted metal-dependent hydrolase
MNPSIAEGIRLFNTQKFFEAHEALETVWLKAQGEEKTILHGLIQVAAAFHHFTRGNLTGFRSLLEKGMTKLEDCGEWRGGIELEGILEQLHPWREFARRGHKDTESQRAQQATPLARPPFPHIPPTAGQ